MRVEITRPDGSRDELEFKNGDASVTLPSWVGHKLVEREGRSDGAVRLVAEEADPSRFRSAIEWLLRNEAEMRSVVLFAIHRQYADMQEQYGYEGQEKADWMPDITQPDDLRELVELRNIHLRDGSGGLGEGGAWPTLGFEMECTWDPEHGCGVLTRGLNADEVGEADAAFS